MHPNKIAKLLKEDYEELEDKDLFKGDLRKLAKDPNTSLEILNQLADHPDTGIRWYVVKNPNSLEIFDKLSNDKEFIIRYYVASNSNTPIEILEKLSNDTHNSIRCTIADNPNTPPEILEKLSKDNDSGVRWCVTKNLEQRQKVRNNAPQ